MRIYIDGKYECINKIDYPNWNNGDEENIFVPEDLGFANKSGDLLWLAVGSCWVDYLQEDGEFSARLKVDSYAIENDDGELLVPQDKITIEFLKKVFNDATVANCKAMVEEGTKLMIESIEIQICDDSWEIENIAKEILFE